MNTLTPSQETALGHLEMIIEMLTGGYNPRHREEEIRKRYAALVSFIRTGQCLAGEEDREWIERVRQLWADMLMERPGFDPTASDATLTEMIA